MRRSLTVFFLIVSPIFGMKNNSRTSAVYKLERNVTENLVNATKYAPQFKNPSRMFPMDVKPSGGTVRFKCPAKGNPQPNITWYKNNVPGIRTYFSEPRFGKWFVEVADLTSYDDGNYTCKVCSELGCIQHTTTLIVQERYPSKPYLKDGYPGNQTVFEAETVKFQCPVISDLEPFVYWIWSPCNSTEKQIMENSYDDLSEGLIIINVTSANEGWYECFAVNSLGNSSARGYLKVKNKEENNGDETTFEQRGRVYSGLYTTMTVTSTCILGIMLLAIALIIVITRRLRLQKIKKQKTVEATMMLMAEGWAKVIRVESHNGSNTSALIMPIVSIEKVRYTELPNDANVSGVSSEYILPIDTKWEVLKENLLMGKILGEGEFGKVVKSEYSGTRHSRLPSTVAVEMLKEDHSDADMLALVSEMEIMKTIGKHENVINLLGCCTQDGPLYVIVEYASNGCLREYLKKHQPNKKSSAEDKGKQLAERDLVEFALQVAKGMEFLVSRGCIHRDLAARNVLVSGARVLKVADFGLARDVRDSDYYRKRTAGKLPVRWMAPESLAHNFYTAYSDAWSFGVLTWEIMTFGCTPYQNISVFFLYQYLKSGQRLSKPEGCCQKIYALMMHCWTLSPQDRPRFSDLVVNLQEILNGLEIVDC